MVSANQQSSPAVKFVGPLLARPQHGTLLKYRQGKLLFEVAGLNNIAIIQIGDGFQIQALHLLPFEILQRYNLEPRKNLYFGKFEVLRDEVLGDVDCLKVDDNLIPLVELATAELYYLGRHAF